jgi:peptide/nickel transport system ATP-binding protein
MNSDTDTSNDILQVQDLNVDAVTRFGETLNIVKNISFSVAAGKVISLIGESGSGKSTISLATMAYARPGCLIRSGKVLLNGCDLLTLNATERQRARGADIAYIAQSAAAAFNGALTIGFQVTEIANLKGIMTKREANERAISLYKQLDLPNPESIGKLYPHQVSGGQLQRLMAAMAMMCYPKLLILDEPTTALDVTTQIEVLQAFKRLIQNENTAAIYVSHDLSVVTQMADEILVLKDGIMVELNTTESIINDPQEKYTKMLMGAVPTIPENPVSQSEIKSESLLKVDNITAGYGLHGQITILKNVSLEMKQGETVGVIGESGSGKTTLGRVISGLMKPREGELLLEGNPLEHYVKDRSRDDLRQIQFVFQMAETALNPKQRIRHLLGRPLDFYLGMTGKEAEDRIYELLDLVELPAEFINRFPRELSGGQLQRINFARALAADPKLIICDEITSALDTLVSKAIIELLLNLKKKLGIAYLFISHDLSTVANLADSVAVMRNGEIVEYGSTEKVLKPPYHEYTELLLDSIPKLKQGWLETVSSNIT